LRRERHGEGGGHRNSNGCVEFHIVVSMKVMR
jgi:hypothetical protein